jgi:hypothetical protein
MKLSYSLAAVILAVAAEAVALPEADALADSSFCLFPGQSCLVTKREADASPLAQCNWCTCEGQSCWKAKREADASAEAQGNYCNFPGQSCWKVTRAAEAFADALHASGPAVTSREADFSNMPGGAAFVAKRQLNSLAQLVSASQAKPRDFYNNLNLARNFFPDQPSHGMMKRDPAAAENDKRHCASEGQTCWKVQRAAEALVGSLGTIQNEVRDVAFETQGIFSREHADIEARCNAPEGLCTQAKRDLHAMRDLAKMIAESA